MFTWAYSNKKNRGPVWYIVGVIIGLTLLIYGLVSQIYLMSIVVVLFGGTFLLIENNSSPVVEVIVTEGGVQVDNSSYSFQDFSAFAIISVKGNPLFLRLIPKKRLMGILEIPLTVEVDVPALQTFLLQILPEDVESKFSGTDALAYMTKI